MKETICISTSIIIPMLQAAGELPPGPIAAHPAQPPSHLKSQPAAHSAAASHEPADRAQRAEHHSS